jgi:photosystem II stability/assembly factor-like uncharacterized protein
MVPTTSRPVPCRAAVVALLTGLMSLLTVGAAIDPGRALYLGPATLAAQDTPNIVANPAMFADMRFRSVGPSRGGRVTAIAGVRSAPCTFYMGGTGGGVWKTTNCGIQWAPISDGQIDTGSIGAIDVSDSNPNIVYVGTGSAAIRSNVILGRGLYKSSDAGETWALVALRNAGQIGSVVIHPTNPDIVWVAAMGSPFGPSDERGIYKTTDGGKTWMRTLFINRETGARVVAINWSNPNEIYAGMYRGFRKGWDIISGGPASEGGIYRSYDGGLSWTKLEGGLPRRLIGKIDIDVSRTRPSVVYAMIEAPGPEGGLYRSDDSGATWRLVNNAQRLRARPFYFNYVDVHPTNENEVWVNDLSLHKSTDGGKTFTVVPTPHGDNHGIWFNPDHPQYAIQCNDGGANITTDGGLSWSSLLNQPTGEFYMVAVDELFPYRLYAPQQDNTTVVAWSLPPTTRGLDHPAQTYTEGPGCETGQIQPRPDGTIIYGACKGEFGRFSVATGQEQQYWVYPQQRYGHNPKDIRYRFPRQTVITVSPHDPHVVYTASHVLHRTMDDGKTWETISGDLTAFEPDKQIVAGTPITRDVTGEEVYSSIYAMTESRLEKGVLWVGANDGPVHVSRDGGKSWTNVTPRDLPPGGRVQTIEDSPHRKGSAYIAVYRYLREHDLEPYIYRTDDYGTSWIRLTSGKNGIPADHPTRVVREDPEREGLLFAGTEFALFVSFDNGAHWQPFQQNLPHTPVTDIRLHRGDLVLSTMGRGLWILDNITPLQQLASRHQAILMSEAYLFPPRAAYRMHYRPSAGDAVAPEFPPPGVYLDYYLAGEPTEDVTITILDAKRDTIRTLSSAAGAIAIDATAPQALRETGSAVLPKKAWHSRVLWDLRHESGPLVVPGTYQVRLAAGDMSQTRALEVKMDPRLAADGTTPADLEEQLDLQIKVGAAIGEGGALKANLESAMARSKASPAKSRALVALYDRLVTTSGVYPQPMLIDQFQNVARMIGQADQKPGQDAWDRYRDLNKELAAIQAEFAKLGR